MTLLAFYAQNAQLLAYPPHLRINQAERCHTDSDQGTQPPRRAASTRSAALFIAVAATGDLTNAMKVAQRR